MSNFILKKYLGRFLKHTLGEITLAQFLLIYIYIVFGLFAAISMITVHTLTDVFMGGKNE